MSEVCTYHVSTAAHHPNVANGEAFREWPGHVQVFHEWPGRVHDWSGHVQFSHDWPGHVQVCHNGQDMYVVGSESFRPDIQKPRHMENAVRDI